MVVIVSVLMGIALPIFSSARRTADKTSCMANLKQIAVATNLAAQDNDGLYPNMHGYAWEQGDIWIADALAPYVSGVVNRDPGKILRCPAAQKNPQEVWLQEPQYCHYKFNIWYAQDKRPRAGYVSAMLFFDATWPDWTERQYAHNPGRGALLNVAYADGHVAAMPYAEYKKLNANADESQNDFFKLGWIETPTVR